MFGDILAHSQGVEEVQCAPAPKQHKHHGDGNHPLIRSLQEGEGGGIESLLGTVCFRLHQHVDSNYDKASSRASWTNFVNKMVNFYVQQHLRPWHGDQQLLLH